MSARARIKYDLIDIIIENGGFIKKALYLPLYVIDTFPFFNIYDLIYSENLLIQKNREYWEDNKNMNINIRSYYADYLDYKTDLCLSFYPELEYYMPAWIYGTDCYILYNNDAKIMATLLFKNFLMKNNVFVKLSNDSLTYENAIQSFKENFNLPSMNLSYSNNIMRISNDVYYYAVMKHPFIKAVEDIKRGIEIYNDVQTYEDFDILQITEAVIYNRTITFLNMIRLLYKKYDILKYYLKDWVDNVRVEIGYYYDIIEKGKRTDGSIISLFYKEKEDKIIVKNMSHSEFNDLRKTLQQYPNNVIFASRSSINRYFKDKIKNY